MTFEGILQVSQSEKLPFDDWTRPSRLTLEGMHLYIDAYEGRQQNVCEVLAEGASDVVDSLA